MQVVYVAGPYRGKAEYEIKKNIENAEKVAAELMKMGYAVICPHKNTAWFGGLVPDEVILAGCIEIMKRCDFVVLVPGWERSQGTLAEIKAAKEKGIPIFKWRWQSNGEWELQEAQDV